LDEFYLAYIDDILIYTDSILKEYQTYIDKILNHLKEAGFQLNINKYKFEIKSTKYFGFIIKAGKGL
jgi:hypothetical protein